MPYATASSVRVKSEVLWNALKMRKALQHDYRVQEFNLENFPLIETLLYYASETSHKHFKNLLLQKKKITNKNKINICLLLLLSTTIFMARFILAHLHGVKRAACGESHQRIYADGETNNITLEAKY